MAMGEHLITGAFDEAGQATPGYRRPRADPRMAPSVADPQRDRGACDRRRGVAPEGGENQPARRARTPNPPRQSPRIPHERPQVPRRRPGSRRPRIGAERRTRAHAHARDANRAVVRLPPQAEVDPTVSAPRDAPPGPTFGAMLRPMTMRPDGSTLRLDLGCRRRSAYRAGPSPGLSDHLVDA
jgi:hypothetical protein